MIKVLHISKKLGKKQVLCDITFEAVPGTCVCIVGANGCGKSTLLSILAGVTKPDCGEITFFGKEPLKIHRIFMEMCGYVPQGNPLMEDLSVRDNLRLWCEKSIEENGKLMERFNLSDMLNMPVKKLSGGMKRRVSIACAVADDQPVLIMDEPTAALDIVQKQMIHQFIADYKKRGGTVILATHDMDEIEMCDAVFFMEEGVLKQLKNKEELFECMKIE